MVGKRIRIELESGSESSPDIEIDGALVAQGLGLDVATFRQLMERRQVTVLCERGTGEDAGLWRASFYHGTRRVRLVVDGDGTPVPGSHEAGENPMRHGAAD